MEEKIRKIILTRFAPEEIESIKIFKNHAIITLQNTDKDAADLKAEIEKIANIEKVSIIYTAEKKATALNPENDKIALPNIKKIIAVASGKGGVGKSTTAVNLALALSKLGLKVAIFDADIYGPSIPKMLGFEGIAPISFDGQNFQPFEAYGLQAMSIGTLIDSDTPLVWRGPKACGALTQLLTETCWQETDVMVIDMPPGTGDIQITLAQKLCINGAVIVSTPQDIALIDAVKGVKMFEKVGIKILGVVENMSYYVCEKCGHIAHIFGAKGAEETAHEMNVPFLGEIPLHINIRSNSDAGTPIVDSAPQSNLAKAYLDIAEKIKATL